MPFGAERLAGIARGRRSRLAGSAASASRFPVASIRRALLHALAALRGCESFRLRAVHVDHGLQAGSGSWAEPAASVCRDAGIPLRVIRAWPRDASGRERRGRRPRSALCRACAAARAGRATAHRASSRRPARDRADPAAARRRGRGPRGDAGAGASRPRLARCGPCLTSITRSFADYAAEHRLAWLRGPDERRARFDRGWLRARVLPAIRERWPAAAETVSRASPALRGGLARACRGRAGRCARRARRRTPGARGARTPVARPPGERASLVATPVGTCGRRRPRGSTPPCRLSLRRGRTARRCCAGTRARCAATAAGSTP